MIILIVSHSSEMFGAERSLLELAEDAVQRGHDVHVCVPRRGPLVERLVHIGASVHFRPTYAWMGRAHRGPIGLVRLAQARWAARGHRALQVSIAPDFVLTNTSVVPSAAWAARSLGIRHLWIVRESLLTNSNLRSFATKSWISRQILANSDPVFAISEFVASQLRSQCKDESHAIETVRPVPRIRSATAGNKKTLRPVTLVLPGTISGEKGQLTAVAGVAKARRCGADVRLQLVGAGTPAEVAKIRKAIAAEGAADYIALLPWTDDRAQMYSDASAVLMTSLNEGFGRTTAEALLCGIPVLAFDAGASPEVLRLGGGILVSPPTIEALAQSLVAFAALRDSEYDRLVEGAVFAGNAIRNMDSPFDSIMRAIS